MKINESGRSMVEMLGVLAVVAVMTTSGIVLYDNALYKYKVDAVTKQIASIVDGIHYVYANTQEYDGLSNENAIEMGAIPEQMIDKKRPGVIVTKFGGEITILPTYSKTGDVCSGKEDSPCDSFMIRVVNLPKKPVTDLSMFSWNNLKNFHILVEDGDKNSGAGIM